MGLPVSGFAMMLKSLGFDPIEIQAAMKNFADTVNQAVHNIQENHKQIIERLDRLEKMAQQTPTETASLELSREV